MDMAQQKVVTIQTSPDAQGLLRVDILASNIPDNFLGIAFHLKISGSAWQMERFTAGKIFEGIDPLILALEKSLKNGEKEIVFGLALKNGQKISANFSAGKNVVPGGGLDSDGAESGVLVADNGTLASDNGVLASFFLKVQQPEALQFEFTNEHFSVFEAGRRDLADVTFQDYKSLPGQTLITQSMRADVLAGDDGQSLINIYSFLAATLIIIAVSLLAYFLTRRVFNRTD